MTLFTTVYDRFLLLITDDIYLQEDNALPGTGVWTFQDTLNELQAFITNATSLFEFPRINLDDYTLNDLVIVNDEVDDTSFFNVDLSVEEQIILANLMVSLWIGRQIASIENTKMKYASADFKMMSQANFFKRLMELQESNDLKVRKLQRLYKRRLKDEDGVYRSTWGAYFAGGTFDN